ARDRTGSAITGPTFSTRSTSMPIPSTGSMMSANITAASTPWARTGCSVTSAQSSGCRQTSKSPYCFRSSRYSGSDRPAWRMNQTGVRSTGSRRAARTSSGSLMLVRLPAAWIRELPGTAEPNRPGAARIAAENTQLQRPLGPRELDAVLRRHADVHEEPPLPHRQPGEAQEQLLEPRRPQPDPFEHLRADRKPVPVPEADRHARSFDALLSVERDLQRDRLTLGHAVAH